MTRTCYHTAKWCATALAKKTSTTLQKKEVTRGNKQTRHNQGTHTHDIIGEHCNVRDTVSNPPVRRSRLLRRRVRWRSLRWQCHFSRGRLSRATSQALVLPRRRDHRARQRLRASSRKPRISVRGGAGVRGRHTQLKRTSKMTSSTSSRFPSSVMSSEPTSGVGLVELGQNAHTSK